ncbi:unnamed protein product [Absidia cylindrospora]
MCPFLSNALNCKKLIESVSSTRPLNDYLNAKLRSKILISEGFQRLNIRSQGTVLPSIHPTNKGYQHGLSLIEFISFLFSNSLRFTCIGQWQLQDSSSIRTIVDTLYATTKKDEVNPLVPIPLGYDIQKRAYWQFGDSPYMWREKAHLKSGCEWEIVCRDMDELRQFADKILEQSKSHKEKKLAHHIKDTLVPSLEEKQRQQEIKDRAKARKIAALLALETHRELPRRARRKPTYYSEDFMGIDDNDDDGDTWIDDRNNNNNNRSTQPPSRRPTRSSGRLHGGDAIVSYMEDMEIDSQLQQQQHQEKGDNSSSSGNEMSISDLEVDIDEKDSNNNVTDSNDDDDVDDDDDIKAQQLLGNPTTWPTPPEKKDQTTATPGYYEEMDEELDIV